MVTIRASLVAGILTATLISGPAVSMQVSDVAIPRAIVLFTSLPADAMERFAAAGITKVSLFKAANAAAIIASSATAAIKAIARWPEVISVYPDRPFSLHMWQANQDTRVDRVRTGLPPLTGPYMGEGITIAVVDAGVDDTHPDLAGKVATHQAFDGARIFVPSEEDPQTGEAVYPDPISVPVAGLLGHTSHGTHLAALAAGTGVAARGSDDMRGVAPRATIVDAAVTSVEAAPFFESNVLAAYEWVLEHRNDPLFPGGIRIAVSGIGATFEVPATRRLLQRVMDAGITVVFPVGNDEDPFYHNVYYPARYPEIIAAGAVRKQLDPCHCDGDVYPYSVHGDAVDVVAPGADVWSAATWIERWHSFNPFFADVPPPGQGNQEDELHNRMWYTSSISTSIAAAQVAGIVALILDANPNLRPDEVQAILKQTARDIATPGFDVYTGYGIVDAFRAVDAAEEFAGPR